MSLCAAAHPLHTDLIREPAPLSLKRQCGRTPRCAAGRGAALGGQAHQGPRLAGAHAGGGGGGGGERQGLMAIGRKIKTSAGVEPSSLIRIHLVSIGIYTAPLKGMWQVAYSAPHGIKSQTASSSLTASCPSAGIDRYSLTYRHGVGADKTFGSAFASVQERLRGGGD